MIVAKRVTPLSTFSSDTTIVQSHQIFITTRIMHIPYSNLSLTPRRRVYGLSNIAGILPTQAKSDITKWSSNRPQYDLIYCIAVGPTGSSPVINPRLSTFLMQSHASSTPSTYLIMHHFINTTKHTPTFIMMVSIANFLSGLSYSIARPNQVSHQPIAHLQHV